MRFDALSDIGLVRKVNQDTCGIVGKENGYMLFMVADGIGGGKAGDVASNMTIDMMHDLFDIEVFDGTNTPVHWLRTAIENVNRAILIKASQDYNCNGMGTTLVGALYTEKKTHVFNVGDSRCYLLKEGQMKCVTKDHTLMASMIENGIWEPQSVLNNASRNVLINALGIDQPLRIDIESYNNDYDAILLCSDGLYGYVDEEEIARVMFDKELTVKEKSRRLVDLANQAGGYDNISIVIMEQGANE